MTYSVQYKVKDINQWFEFHNTNDPKEAEKLERELQLTFKTRILKE